MDISGANETTLFGNVNNFDIEIYGASDLDAEKLKTINTSLDILDAGNAIVFAKKTLNIEISVAGNIQYKGTPKIKKHISEAGSITKI